MQYLCKNLLNMQANLKICKNMQKNAKILCENQEIFNFSICFEVYSA